MKLPLLFIVGLLAFNYSPELLAQEVKPNVDKMVKIRGGFYRPLFASKDDLKKVRVKAFKIDAYPVTASAFLAFVQANPKWRRSQRKSIFADKGYLASWRSDTDLGKNISPQSPAVQVSWFAAKAYCAVQGKRLPSVAQWEYVAAASEKKRYAMKNKAHKDKLLKWYSKPTARILPDVGTTYPANVFGVFDLHGVVWEWTRDFNTSLVTGESRGDSALDKKLYCGSGSVGAADFEDYAAFMRYAFRSSLEAKYTVASMGFRCMK